MFPHAHLILGLSFALVLLIVYSALIVSSRQVDRARKRYKEQPKFQRNFDLPT